MKLERRGRKAIHGERMNNTITFNATDEQDRSLKLMSEIRNISKSEIIRIAVDEYLINILRPRGGDDN